jgi:hypothetical protein
MIEIWLVVDIYHVDIFVFFELIIRLGRQCTLFIEYAE